MLCCVVSQHRCVSCHLLEVLYEFTKNIARLQFTHTTFLPLSSVSWRCVECVVSWRCGPSVLWCDPGLGMAEKGNGIQRQHSHNGEDPLFMRCGRTEAAAAATRWTQHFCLRMHRAMVACGAALPACVVPWGRGLGTCGGEGWQGERMEGGGRRIKEGMG